MVVITKILKEHGFKVTPQRLAVYNVLKNTKEHPGAEAIYNQLLPMYPTMSLATVYKSLEVFKSIGLIQELDLGEGSSRYDANTKQHPHIHCLKCGRVDDVDDVMIDDLLDKVKSKTGYNLVKQQLYFYGYCPKCQQAH
ncbi:transcriptional regulator PerR [Lutispora thermophila]|uniref:Fur family transcriptional regulator, peroxide stress response regulator n=1 Tax=Lutispora thermophila DSM 19022 TaxID=1122184 RepID=A0A1M6B258_9FIRM|nr:Fur family transcriptional regulator [Lutispora thermophila]SHI42805.1 Fur family transcriptional regulator, peroxide stress response regulator [Lutispora thermophila DSM 19022]